MIDNSEDIAGKLETALKQCEVLRAENAKLKEQLGINHSATSDTLNDSIVLPSPTSTQYDKEGKIRLFRNLFQGREDVFALRWDGRNGKSGYSPSCANLWQQGLCTKTSTGCAKCPNKDYVQLTDQEIHKHLTGKQVIGLYPMLKAETCYLLAVDFDKSTWQEDIAAYRNMCREKGIDVAVERSRSGNGGHAWLFFSETLPARLARQLGSYLLTLAMERRHQIGFDSYDRMFPNQDTLPKGGFGNLIALPLQYNARQNGNTLFLDEHFQPYSDQWSYLSAIQKISKTNILNILKDVQIHRSVLSNELETEGNAEAPWIKTSSIGENAGLQPIPDNINIVISNLIYIEKAGLPSWAINKLFRLAAFPNPEFYQAQAQRRPTYDKPRIISCGEEFPNHIGLPRGIQDAVLALFANYNTTVATDDRRNQGQPIEAAFTGLLHPSQLPAAESILAKECGVLSAATAFGKTVVAAYVIAARKTNTLILVHRQQLMDQWHERLKAFLAIGTDEIGRIGGGRNAITGKIDIAMIQSLQRMDDLDGFIKKYGQIIVDECHHIPAFSFEKVVKRTDAKYILGLTATPLRKDGHHPIITMQCGPVVYKAGAKAAATAGGLHCRVFRKATAFVSPIAGELPIQDLYHCLALDGNRNALIFDGILRALEEKRSPLVLTERRDHLELLYDKLRSFARNIIVFRGGMSKKQRQAAMDQLRAIPPDEERLILATGRYIGEGFDDARLDTLFITLPIAWKGTLQQYAGRIHRRQEGKTDVVIYDYVDENMPVLKRMFEKRIKGYKAMGYEIKDNH